MGSFLQQLENEAILLMYLAGELAPEDRAEVEQMLATDGKLRADLAQLEEAHNSVRRHLQQLDDISSLPASPDVALRRVSRMMKQWQVDQLAAAPIQVSRPRRHVPWWVYAGASAAAAVVAVIVWWGMQSDVPVIANNTTAVVAPVDEGRQQDEQLALLNLTLQNGDDNSPIAQAENEAQQLSTQRKENDQPLSLFILNTGQTD
jgi:anti-sigma factor RsiW